MRKWVWQNRTVQGTDYRDFLISRTDNQTISAYSGNDWIIDRGGSNAINGGDGHDVNLAGRGNDGIVGGPGSDFVFGGRGFDTSSYSGDIRDYTVRRHAGFWFVSERATQETDILLKVEQLTFDNAAVFLDGRNNLPIADNIQVETSETGPPITIDLKEASRAFDFDGDQLSITAVGQTTHLTYDPGTGLATFDPGTGFLGLHAGDIAVETHSFEISDGTASISRTMTVTIHGENTPPLARDDTFSIDEDAALIAGNLFADNGAGADFDPDGPFTVSRVNGQASFVGNQIVLPSGALLLVGPDGQVAYDPNGSFEALGADEPGSDSFTYTIEDENGAKATATAEILVAGIDNALVARDDAFEGDEDTPTTGNVFSDNGSGPDTDPDNPVNLTIVAVNGLAGNVGSTIVVAGADSLIVNSDGSLNYNPLNAFQGLSEAATDIISFTYTVENSITTEQAEATVVLTIKGINDPPAAMDDSVQTSIAEVLAGNVLIDNGNGADSDAEGDDLSVSAVNGSNADIGTEIILASGALLTLNADGTFVYDPNAAFDELEAGGSDIDSFDYTLSDGKGGFGTATVTVTVNAPASPFTGVNAGDLDGGNGFVIAGFSRLDGRREWSGYSVGGDIDLNGDGFSEVVVGAPLTQYRDGGVRYAGSVGVVLGGSSVGSGGTVDLNALDGDNGFELQNLNNVGWFGNSVSGEDVDGDDRKDLLIGAPSRSITTNGQTQVIGEVLVAYAGADEFEAVADIGDLSDPRSASKINGTADYLVGTVVAAAGDINGDDIGDFLVSGALSETAFLVFGSGTFPVLDFFDDSYADGSAGIALTAPGSNNVHTAVGGAGDFTDDGNDDYLLGHPNYDNDTGIAFLMFGGPDVEDGSVDLEEVRTSFVDPRGGLISDSAGAAGDLLGYDVASLGDVNGDDIDDIIVSAPGKDGSGAAYVIYGRPTNPAIPFLGDVNVIPVVSAIGFKISGAADGDRLGFSVAGAGDVNNDGLGDIILGAPGAGGTGAAYVIYGAAGTSRGTIELASFDPGDGFVITGIDGGDQAGFSVAGAGDVNGDNFDDVIVGAPGPTDSDLGVQSGEAYVVFGGNFTSSADDFLL